MNNNPQNAQEIFGQALDIADEAARRAYLDRACGGDAGLRQEVESLLAANSAAGEFLQHPAPVGAGAAQRTMLLPPLSEKTGTRIGRYKLLEQIGEGGFGVVWMAEQEEPVRRRVALKIIKLGMDTKEVVARFEAERQALAMMDHPNIASVFDGGATETGRPYFVMELVKGVSITEYCDVNKLATRERLELFMQVCQAVQHAHQKGIIHRDIKPSNVLVTVKDDRPVPKVIDFGVAKATQARLTEKTVFTRFHQWIGTPAYMSPEQAGLASLDVDTRSDVYSLGVLLYELLTGRTPFDTSKLLEKGYEAVMRTIREEEPPKPSTRLSTLAEEELSTVAAQRGSEPAKLGRVVRGDLDWIVMKALEKDRQRRYETTAGLAQDLERHLNSEPVTAVAPGALYRLSKFARRHRLALATCSAIGLTVLTGTTVSVWQAVRATRFARQADTQQRIATSEALRAAHWATESDAARRRAETNAYIGRILLASQFLQSGDIANAEQTLDSCEQTLRRWEWNYLKRSLHGELLKIPPPRGFDGDYNWTRLVSRPSEIVFTRDGSRLWISRHPQYNLLDQGFFSVADGSRLAGSTNTYPGFPNRDGSRIVRRATAGTAAAFVESTTGAVLVPIEAIQDTPVSLSPDESWIASWGARPKRGEHLVNRLLIASANTGHLIHEIELSDGDEALLWSPDSRWLVAAGETTNHVIEPQSGRVMFAFKAVVGNIPGGLAFSTDSRRLARISTKEMEDEDDRVQVDPLSVWDLSTQRLQFEQPLPDAVFWTPAQVCFAEGDQTLVVAFSGLGGDKVSRSDLMLFDATTGKLKRELRLDSRRGSDLEGIVTLAVSPDGAKVAAGTMDGHLHLVGITRPFQRRLGQGRQNMVHRIAINGDGSLLAALDNKGEVTLWDASEPEKLGMEDDLSESGRFVLRAAGTGVRIEDLDRRESLTLDSRATLSPDGKWLCRADGVWDMLEHRRVHLPVDDPSLAEEVVFSPDCRRATIYVKTRRSPWETLSVQVVDAATWVPVTERPLGKVWQKDSKVGFTFNFDGTLVALQSSNNWVSLYEFSTNSATPQLRCVFAGGPPFHFGPDGSWLLTARPGGGFQQVDAQRGTLIRAYPDIGGSFRRFEISRSGRHACVYLDSIFAGSSAGSAPALLNNPWRLQVWDLTTGQLIARVRQTPSQDSSVFHPDGTRMVLPGQDSVLGIWDLATKALVVTLPAQSKGWRWSRDGGKLTAVTLAGEILEFDGSDLKAGEVKVGRVPFTDVTPTWLTEK